MFSPTTELLKFIDDTKTGFPLKMVTFENSPYGHSFKNPEQRNSLEDNTLQKICIKCWGGIVITDDEHKQFSQIIQTPEGRRSWLYYLNERRTKSHFKLAPIGFAMLSKLLQVFLDCICECNDEYSAKMAIVLSQTFFQEKPNEKVFLQNSMVNHTLWTREDIWILMVEDGIKKEMENYAQFCTDETSEEHRERMFAIIFSQLSSYIHIMNTFKLTKEFMKKIVEIFSSKYQLPELATLGLLE